MVPRDVPASGCLNGNFETRLEDLRGYRTCEIQAFSHCPGGRQQLVNCGDVHGDIDIETTVESCQSRQDLRVGLPGKLVGSPSNIRNVWLVALGYLWHGLSPLSVHGAFS